MAWWILVVRAFLQWPVIILRIIADGIRPFLTALGADQAEVVFANADLRLILDPAILAVRTRPTRPAMLIHRIWNRGVTQSPTGPRAKTTQPTIPVG